MTLDIQAVRARFPALTRTVAGQPAAFFDGPAGSQVPRSVIDAVVGYLAHGNANTGGAFATSIESEAMLAAARAAMCDLFGTDDPDCVVFGPNMTTLTFALSRALAATWQRGDEIVVTRLDHDANVTPWVRAAADAGCELRKIPFLPADTTLDLNALRAALSPRTRLVAVGAASNATGTLTPIPDICALARAVGAEVFVDAVHYAPHALMDVRRWGCTYAVCSTYKFFGPHLGVLWGERDRLAALPSYQCRAAGDALPHRWTVGTQSHEGIAGALAAIEYLADLGRDADADADADSRRDALAAGFAAIHTHERALLERFLSGLRTLPNVTVWGITDPARLDERVPTVSFTHATCAPADIARRFAERGLFVWHGNYYAIDVTESLGLEPDGMVRVGILHYNTADEIDRLLAAIAALG